MKAFELKQIGPVLLIVPSEKELLHRDRINLISDELSQYVGQHKPKQVVYSLKQVAKYSSQAIGGLVFLVRQIRAYGGQMKLCMGKDIRTLFQVAGLDGTLFEIYDNESDCVASFFEHGKDIM